MSESIMRRKLVKALDELGAISVENPVHPGTPDISYVEGWIECKWLRSWPRDDTTSVRIPHFTQYQRSWLRRRHDRGGACWVALQCRREWLFIPGLKAAMFLHYASYWELVNMASLHLREGLDRRQVIGLLKDAQWPYHVENSK